MLYKSSKGEREISEMPLPYAKNALGKLLRDEPGRTAEIDALQAHVDTLTAQAEAEGENPRAVLGGNNPPEAMTEIDRIEVRGKEIAEVAKGDEPNGREAVETHVSDLLTEAANWADGVALIDQAQADAVGRLHRMLQEAAGLVDDAATKEKKPLNEAIAEIAAWQNGYTAKGLKKTPDGKLTKALSATGNLSAGWLRKMDAERIEREKIAAELAHKAAQEAVALREEAKVTTDIAVMDRAEDAIADAKNLLSIAEGFGKDRVRLGGGDGFRAMTLRSTWSAHIDPKLGGWGAAYAHYKTDPDFMAEFHALIQRWADRDCRTEASRLRGVPGFNFIEQKVAA
jgi:hypothetical protein